MPRFATGVVRFQKNVYPENKALFEQLSTGQSPEALFITCSDSRIEPAMITQTGPGELFVCRNAGNIVPPHSDATSGMSASIEYATAVLKVPHIVVCGHSGCGAMAGAMDPQGLAQLPRVLAWVNHCQAAVAAVNERGGALDDAARMNMLVEQNVILQLLHLQTHPAVAQRLAHGDLHLHGWVYDIGTGAVNAYDDQEGHFHPLAEHYAAELADQAHAH